MSSAEYVLPGDDASAPGYKPHKIEILAEGQQFVAFNDHPDTGKPYFWNGAGDPLCVPVGLLPSANRADFAAALEEAERVLARRGTKFCATPNHDSGGVHKPHGDPRASDPAILRAALRAIPNAGATTISGSGCATPRRPPSGRTDATPGLNGPGNQGDGAPTLTRVFGYGMRPIQTETSGPGSSIFRQASMGGRDPGPRRPQTSHQLTPPLNGFSR